MKKALGWALLVCVGIGFTALSASATEVVSVQVAPHMLLLSKVQSGEVTVHVGIPFSVVVESTIFMNGVAVSWTKADDCGNLVAKFDEESVKAVVEAPSTTLTLIGTTTGGVDFSGSDTVKVKD